MTAKWLSAAMRAEMADPTPEPSYRTFFPPAPWKQPSDLSGHSSFCFPDNS